MKKKAIAKINTAGVRKRKSTISQVYNSISSDSQSLEFQWSL